jgi:hypothetical protein
MPETSEQSARIAVARLQKAFASTPSGRRGDALGFEVVTSSEARSLVEALDAAEERLRTTGRRRASSAT